MKNIFIGIKENTIDMSNGANSANSNSYAQSLENNNSSVLYANISFNRDDSVFTNSLTHANSSNSHEIVNFNGYSNASNSSNSIFINGANEHSYDNQVTFTDANSSVIIGNNACNHSDNEI